MKKILLFILAFLSIFTISACSKNSDERSYAYIGEQILVHNEYEVTLKNVRKLEEIDIEGFVVNPETNEQELGTIHQDDVEDYYFVAVDVEIRHKNIKVAEDYVFDASDFKLKDHTSWKHPLQNKIKKDENTFKTVSAIEDLAWCKKTLSPKNTMNFTIYFEIPVSVNYEEAAFVTEVDFYIIGAPSGLKYSKGVDILLSERV